MSVVKDSLPIPQGWSRAYLAQLLSYVEHRDLSNDYGWYYGNKNQFEKRHEAIKEWLQQQVEYAYSEGVVLG
jgi:hypothetical protein